MSGLDTVTTHSTDAVHQLCHVKAQPDKEFRLKSTRLRHLLIYRLLALFVMVLNAHSQALFVAADPAAKYTVLVYASISCILGPIAIACLFVYRFQEQLGQQLEPFADKGKVFYCYVFISLVPDFLGLLLTCLLAHRLQYNKYAYTSNLLPAGLSILNTLISASV